MKHPLPARPSLGEHDGLSYALFLPEDAPRAGVVICHGAGAAKESHFDFARVARDRGMAALAYDARGHGRSSGSLGPGLAGDALAMCDLMRSYSPAVALRGSSLGGFTAIMAAAASHGTVGAVVALCPAPGELLARAPRSPGARGAGGAVVARCPARGELLARALRSPEPREIEFRADVEHLEPWLASVSLV